MPNTSKFGLPYPALSDAPNGPVAIFNLAQGVDGLGIIGGKRRTGASSNITTVESVVVDTQNLAMAASSVFLIDYDLCFTCSVAATDLNMTIRLTSVSGTVVAGPLAVPGPYTTQGNHGRLALLYKTTSAELDTFVGTVIRQAGTGNIQAIVPTTLTVTRLGPSSLIGDF